MRAATALGLSLFLAASPAWAADSETELWTTLSASMPMSSNVTGSLTGSQRFRTAKAGGDQWLVQGAIDVKLAPGLSGGVSGGYFETAATRELRTSQQFTFTTGPLSMRSQLDERFFDGHTRMGLRFRERAQVRVPVSKADRLGLSVEGLFVLQSIVPGKQTGFDQIRFNISDEHRLTGHLGLSLGYLFIYAYHKGGVDKISHVPQLTLSWKG